MDCGKIKLLVFEVWNAGKVSNGKDLLICCRLIHTRQNHKSIWYSHSKKNYKRLFLKAMAWRIFIKWIWTVDYTSSKNGYNYEIKQYLGMVENDAARMEVLMCTLNSDQTHICRKSCKTLVNISCPTYRWSYLPRRCCQFEPTLDFVKSFLVSDCSRCFSTTNRRSQRFI